MHSSRTVASTTALAGAACSVAFAQINTQVIFEASRDGGLTWSDRVEAFPGENILVHARIRYFSTDTSTVFGLAGITFQPKLTNWNPASDSRLPFFTPDGSAVPREQPNALGRVYPFASSGMNSASASGLLTSHVDGGATLRFAGANAVTATTNLAWGVSCGQVPRQLNPTGFRTETDIVVFRYGVNLGGESPRDLLATVARTEIVSQRATWYLTIDSRLASVRDEDILPATIHYIPTPITLTPFLAWPILASRRRR